LQSSKKDYQPGRAPSRTLAKRPPALGLSTIAATRALRPRGRRGFVGEESRHERIERLTSRGRSLLTTLSRPEAGGRTGEADEQGAGKGDRPGFQEVRAKPQKARPGNGDSSSCGGPGLSEIDFMLEVEEDIVCGGDTRGTGRRIENLAREAVLPGADGGVAKERGRAFLGGELPQIAHEITQGRHAHLIDEPGSATGKNRTSDGERQRQDKKQNRERAERDVHACPLQDA
jgi:hypothetical protein